MVGTTLLDIRKRINEFACEDGDYRLVCGRTGKQPMPVVGERFPDRETAAVAARATERYRAALRRYDPRALYYDVVVCEVQFGTGEVDHVVCDHAEWSLSDPVLMGQRPTASDRQRVSFCHDVAAAVFEALSAGGYDSLDSAVMDAYFELAERLVDPDELCLCLLESMAAELHTELEPGEQFAVLTDAAARLGSIDDGDPLVGVSQQFEAVGLVADFSRLPWAKADDGTHSVAIDLRQYALSPTRDRLPIMPIVLDLYRRRFDQFISSVRARELEDGWRVTFELGADEEPASLVCARIAEGES